MSFERTEYSVVLREARYDLKSSQQWNQPSLYPDIECQSATVVYQVNGLPSAKVELPTGFVWGSQDAGDASEWLELWAASHTQVEIIVTRSTNNTNSSRVTITRECIFTGYLLVPTIELLKSGAGYSFQLQHFFSDLATSSLMISYAMPTHPNASDAANIYKSGGVEAALPQGGDTDPQGTQVNVKLEGIAWQLGLPDGWQTTALDDVWGNIQKPILKALIDKKIISQPLALNGPCRNALNQPSAEAGAALDKISPVPANGTTTYSGTYGRPLSLAKSIDPAIRGQLGEQIAFAIGNVPVSGYGGQTAWDRIMQFCAEFDLLFVARANDGVIIPATTGLNKPYAVEIYETDYQELGWVASQQIGIRGIGILASMQQTVGGGLGATDDGSVSANGCFIADATAAFGQNRSQHDFGLIHYQNVPRWMANIPPASLLAAGIRTGSGSTPFTPASPAGGTAAPPAQSYGDLYTALAHMRYLQAELNGRAIQLGGRYRTDIAPGSLVRVRVDPANLNMKTALKTENLIGMVTSVTLSVSRSGGRAFTAFQLNYACTESQLSDPNYTIDAHPFFGDAVKGLPLTDSVSWQATP
jgi:hypothetical protein